MADMFSRERRSAIMARIQSKGNQTTELRFIRLLKKHGITGWRRGSKLFGRPDFVFRNLRLVVFIDGDFWHGNSKNYRLPKSNCAYWQEKIARNRSRDRLVNRKLREAGWIVIRFWESSLSKEQAVARRLKLTLDSLKKEPSPED